MLSPTTFRVERCGRSRKGNVAEKWAKTKEKHKAVKQICEPLFRNVSSRAICLPGIDVIAS